MRRRKSESLTEKRYKIVEIGLSEVSNVDAEIWNLENHNHFSLFNLVISIDVSSRKVENLKLNLLLNCWLYPISQINSRFLVWFLTTAIWLI